MSTNAVRRLGNIRKWGSGVWKCQNIGFEDLEMTESRLRGLVNIRKFASKAWKCQKVGFEGL